MPISQRCMTCRYRKWAYIYYALGSNCDYMIETGQRRACPPGDACSRWEPKTDDVPKKHPVDLHRLMQRSAAKARIRETICGARHFDRMIGCRKEG